MQLKIRPLKNVYQTGAQMKRLSTQYFNDLEYFKRYDLIQFFDFVRLLPYLPDPDGVEFISRPAATIQSTAKHRDCDDKAILIAAFLTMQKLGKRWRFCAISKNPNQKLHHVLVHWDLGNGSTMFLDATYPSNKFFMAKKYTKVTPICEWVNVA